MKQCGLLLTVALALGVTAACGGDSTSQPRPTESAASEVGELGLPGMESAPKLTPQNGTPGGVGLEWWGQSMFLLRSPRGADIAMDPFGDIGYRVPDSGDVGAGIVTVSHEHEDHNNTSITGARVVLRGLTNDDWTDIDQRPTSDVRIRSVPSWHDDSQGEERGRNAIFVFETGGVRIVHLGDLGHRLTQAQIDAIGPVDVLLVPVGGFFTIDASGATDVMEQLQPRVTIPMHYKTKSVTIRQLKPAQPFFAGKQVEEKNWSVTLYADRLPEHGSGVVWVLEPKAAQE